MLISMCAIGKMIVAPAITARYAYESLWISALINFAVDGLFVFFLLKMNDRFGGKSFYDILVSSFGKVFAKVVYFIFFIYFVVRAFIPIVEQKNYIEIALYETAPSVLTFLIFFFFSAFICYKGVRAVGRCADITVWIAVFGISVLLALSLSLTDFTNLLPIIGVPADKLFEGAKNTAVWYLDGAYILFLLGNFKAEKNYKTKIMCSYGVMALLVTLYMAILYGEFGALTERQYFSPIQMGKSNVALSSIGRVDYIAGFVFALVCAFNVALPLVFACEALDKTFEFKKKIIPPLIVNGISIAALLVAHNNFIEIFRFLSKNVIWAYAFVAYAVPLVLLIFARRKTV